LDLGGLQSADKPGVRALRGLVAEGAKVARASPYISRVLDIEADSATPGAGSLIP
jgi:transaldolase